MLQPRNWHLLFFGLLSSFVIYNIHFAPKAALVSSINSSVVLEPLSGKQHILITSGAGFLGSHLALALLDEGHAVTLVDDLSKSSISHLYKLLGGTTTRLKVLSCNLSSMERLSEVLAAAQPHVVVHLADHTGEGLAESQPLQYLSNSTSHVLSLLRAVDNTTVSKLIVSSSYAVYGRESSLPHAEDAACCQPSSAKGHAALFTENAVRAYAAANPDFTSVILRHGSIMGADPKARLGQLRGAWTITDVHGAQSTMMHSDNDALSTCLAAAVTTAARQGLPQQQAEQQQHELVVPDTDERSRAACFKEYVHVADLAAGFIAAMDMARNPPAVYNVGPGVSYSPMDVWKACNKLFGVVPQGSKQLLSAAACQGIIGNVSKLTLHTGWSTQYQLEDALTHAVQWQQSAAANIQ